MSLLDGLRRQTALTRLRYGAIAGQKRFSVAAPRCLPVLLSTQFIPTLHSEGFSDEQLDSVKLLLRGGYIRQSSSGFYTLLPIGLRMVRKIESIVDEEMEKMGASKMELPSLLSSALWHKSGRFDTMGSELYKVKDRKGSEYILAPTFEEEITKLVGEEVHSWRNLPVKVYQITRKYRDEPRPRNGLLRTKEFIMKDLYTFDADLDGAQESYKQVRLAYDAIMTRLFGTRGVNWKIAEADTGAMGGAQSHEYQVQDEAGEDELFVCSDCSYTANGELASAISLSKNRPISEDDIVVSLYGSDDLLAHGCTMTAVISSKGGKVNGTKLAKHLSDGAQTKLSSQSVWDWEERPEGPMIRFDQLKILVDSECNAVEVEDVGQAILGAVEEFGSPQVSDQMRLARSSNAPNLQDYFQRPDAITTSVVDLRQAEESDTCSSCRVGTLQRIKAIEVGHTFLLGTRYTKALGYQYASQDGKSKESIQMGCYGIGITRILGVLAQLACRRFETARKFAHHQGFLWTRSVAPFPILLLPLVSSDKVTEALSVISQSLQGTNTILEGTLQGFHSQDIAIDDRTDLSSGVRLSQVDVMGYPFVLILGKHFEKTGEVEVRVRNDAGIKTTFVPLSLFTI